MNRFSLLSFLFIGFVVYGQTDTTISKPKLAKNSFYFELMGNTTLYALNYERILYTDKYIGAYATLGGTHILGSYSLNTGFKKSLSMPAEINHSKLIVGGSMMFRKELFWKWFNIQRVAKNKKNKVSYVELGFYHVWNKPKDSPSNNPGGTFERANPWNNIYVGCNLFRTNRGVFVRFGLMVYLFKKGPNVLDEISGHRVSLLPFPRLMIGYTF